MSAIASLTVGWNIWLWSATAFAAVVVLCLFDFGRFLEFAYRSRYRGIIHKNSQLNRLQLAGARHPAGPTLSVADIYVDVQLRTKQPGSRDQPAFGPTPSSSSHRLKLDELLRHDDSSAYSIRGRPGDGKTTLLRATAIKLTEPGRVFRPLPVLVVLPRHAEAIASDDSIGLAEVAMGEPWLRTSPITVDHMRNWLRSRRVVVMLDGLDEVEEAHRAKVTTWVDRIRAGNFRGSLIVAGRPQGFNPGMLAQAPVILDICSLSRSQIRLFINKCFSAARGKSGYDIANPAADPVDLLGQLDNNPHMFDLAMTPLLLHIIVYRDLYLPRGMSGSRAQLYEEFVEILLHSRRTLGGAGEASADPEFLRKLAIMRQLAFELMVGQDRYFPARERIGEVLQHLGVQADPHEVATDAHQHGLLVAVDGANSAFAHLSFQEYLAASHIVEADLSDLLIANISSGWWRNTTILWAAQTDPEPVIAACQHQGGGDAWELAIDCANEAAARGFAIDKFLKGRIEDFLERDHPPSSDEYHVACTEVIRRNLQQIAPLHGEVLACKSPVGMPLWRLRERVEWRQQRHPSAHRQARDASLRGLWPDEVGEFRNWLNTFDHRGFTYRLPTEKEGRAILRSRWSRKDPVGLWVQSQSGIRPLYLGSGNEGFAATEPALGRLLGADWSDTAGLIGHLQGSVSPAQRNAARMVTESMHELLESITSAQETVKSHAIEHGEYAGGQTQAAQEQSARLDRLLNGARALAQQVQERTSLFTALGSVEELRDDLPSQARFGLTPAHVNEIKRQVNALQAAMLSAYDKTFQEVHRRINVRHPAAPLVTPAAALLLAPGLALEGGRGPVPGSMPVSSAPYITKEAAGLPLYPEDVLSELDRLVGLLRVEVKKWGDQRTARMLIAMIGDLRTTVAPSLERKTALDRGSLRIARLALVGLVTRLHAGAASAAAVTSCCRCIAGLAIIEMRTSGDLTMNEAIVFVRDDR
ncbi:NACHT domain-containing protein [Glycomyces dulcitolivorans]|uniref:NACHT domain-containing protein n=1 Tax=Glycomyces dulcitolivorans TaxID=2200759 RepID=UPI0013003A67|nr:NACHT domain-containing protein [Glycomyces dulcitolivorans]